MTDDGLIVLHRLCRFFTYDLHSRCPYNDFEMKFLLPLSYRDTNDADGEAKAASSLGEVFLQMGEYDKAMDYHQMDYDISESHEIMEGKVCYISSFIV